MNLPRFARLLLLAPIVLAPGASAQWTETFDSYPNGASLEGNFGAWEGWNGVNTSFSVVSNQQAFDLPNSVQVNPGSDTVYPFLAYNTGQWELTTEQYIPQAFVGKTYFIILNKYNTANMSYEWAVQIGFNGDSGMLECDCGSTTQVTLPLIRGQWTEIRAEIDLTGDMVTLKYGGTVLASYPWSGGALGNSSFNGNRVRAINLYSDTVNFPHVTEVYYDNFSLQAGGNVGTAYCLSLNNSSGAPAAISGSGSSVVSSNSLRLSASPLPNTTGLFFYSANQAQVSFGNGYRCVAGPIARLGMQTISGGVLTQQLNLLTAPTQSLMILPGSSWNFQAWYMDAAGGGAGFNTSDALTVSFQ